jgi:starch-binding outer membrane protein SusE/F
MKKLSILILAIGLFSMVSCKKDETKTTIAFFNPSSILTPSDASKFVLKEANKDSVMFAFAWSAAEYNLTNLIKPTYTLEMDTMGNNFASPKTLSTSQAYSYNMTEGMMNDLILSVFNGLGDSAATFQFRVKASLSADNPATNNISKVVTLEITPYSAFVYVPPIYMLGDATSVGWDNSKALEMTHLTGGQFAIVDHLTTPGKFLKFIADLKAWAPQWGTDAAGTAESGNLVLRPTESQPDPPGIPSPAVEGDYRVVADTAALTYQVSITSSQLFLVGDATTAGWTLANGIAFTKKSPGIFELTTTLSSTGFLKFMETTTGWAPQWGTDASGTGNFGNLVYRPTESVPDPAGVPTPGAGTYTIKINLITLTYTISAGK